MTDTIKGTMTGKERMRAALLGEPVDRVPIWLREGFDFHLGLPDADDFSLGWRAEAEYRELWGYAGEYCDLRSSWSPGGHFNRVLGIDPAAFESRTETVSDDIERVHTTVHTPAGNLVGVSERRRGAATSWSIGYPVGTTADLDALRRVPFDVAPVRYEGYERLTDALGDRGVACLSVSCPWVVFSTVTCFEQALIWSITHRDMVHEVLDEITTRILACLEAVFSRPLDTVVNIGGSEQCTPSMMRPEAYAEFVTPYESRIVSFLRNKGVPVNCHLGATSVRQIVVSTASTCQKNGRSPLNLWYRQCWRSRVVSGVTCQRLGSGRARQASTCDRTSLMIVVRMYCCSLVESPSASLKRNSSCSAACVAAFFRFFGFGIGEMNSGRRRVSRIFCVGCPSTSSQ